MGVFEINKLVTGIVGVDEHGKHVRSSEEMLSPACVLEDVPIGTPITFAVTTSSRVGEVPAELVRLGERILTATDEEVTSVLVWQTGPGQYYFRPVEHQRLAHLDRNAEAYKLATLLFYLRENAPKSLWAKLGKVLLGEDHPDVQTLLATSISDIGI